MLGAAGMIGAMAAVALVMILAPSVIGAAGYAPVVAAMAKIAAWIIGPSVVLTVISSLLAIAVHAPFQDAGWVWVMLVAHEFSQPRRSAPAAFLLSQFDGFVGWLVLAWTLALAWPLWRFYVARSARRNCVPTQPRS